jgi:hypothetical protein
MAKKHELKWNIADLTDPEIYDAIHYLEPHPGTMNEKQDDIAALWPPSFS